MVERAQTALSHHLQEQGFLPINIRPRGWSLSFRSQKRRQAIKAEDFIVFNQQFVALIRAGLPILKSLDLLKGQLRNPLLKEHIINVRDRVHSGELLSSHRARMSSPACQQQGR